MMQDEARVLCGKCVCPHGTRIFNGCDSTLGNVIKCTGPDPICQEKVEVPYELSGQENCPAAITQAVKNCNLNTALQPQRMEQWLGICGRKRCPPRTIMAFNGCNSPPGCVLTAGNAGGLVVQPTDGAMAAPCAAQPPDDTPLAVPTQVRGQCTPENWKKILECSNQKNWAQTKLDIWTGICNIQVCNARVIPAEIPTFTGCDGQVIKCAAPPG